MSQWTHIMGTIKVMPLGTTQLEKRYILETVLAHLPLVTGSEENMHVHVVEQAGCSSSCSHNEFGESLRHRHLPDGNLLHTQDYYFITIEGDFRDRELSQTVREFTKWINRLAKRAKVERILVSIQDEEGGEYVFQNSEACQKMFEWPSWCPDSGREPAWAEYLMWERVRDGWYPMVLAYKYHKYADNDAEMERRMAYQGR